MTIFRKGLAIMAGVAVMFGSPALAQIETIDPNAAYGQPSSPAGSTSAGTASSNPVREGEWVDVPAEATPVGSEAATASDPAYPSAPVAATASSATYQEDDLIGAAEGVFGKGAEGLARMIQDLLKKQGEPNGYIVGREGGGAFVLGVRYGSGTLHHKVEGKRPVYWTGPSLGLDVGANAGNTFVLVYNLYDSEDLFKRFGAAEGQAYLVGGFHASYMRKDDVVLIPIRMGVGLRLGVNAGYMKFSRKQNWLPF